MAREVDALLGLVFAEQRKSGRLDLEAIEMAMRAAMHRAGAGGLEQLLEMSPPVERVVNCGCGQQARFHEMRPKHIVTALGRIRVRRAYYLCSHCQQGQSPADLESPAKLSNGRLKRLEPISRGGTSRIFNARFNWTSPR